MILNNTLTKRKKLQEVAREMQAQMRSGRCRGTYMERRVNVRSLSRS